MEQSQAERLPAVVSSQESVASNDVGDAYATLVGSQLLAADSDNVEDWLEDEADIEDDESPTTGPTGSTPFRGPLVRRAERLRETCMAMLGDRMYGQALKVLKTAAEDQAESQLVALLGPEQYEACSLLLNHLLMCEQSLQQLAVSPLRL